MHNSRLIYRFYFIFIYTLIYSSVFTPVLSTAFGLQQVSAANWLLRFIWLQNGIKFYGRDAWR